MAADYLLDARRPASFFIEADATRYIPAIGSDAWTVYTLLVQNASQGEQHAGRPVPDTIAERSGLAEPVVRRAIRQLVQHGLVEIVEQRRDGHDGPRQTYRIVSAGQAPERDDAWIRERQGRMAGRHLFEALIQECDYDEIGLDDGARRQVISAVETIRSVGGTAGQVPEAALLYREAMPGLPLTPRNLAMCWPMLAEMLAPEEALPAS